MEVICPFHADEADCPAPMHVDGWTCTRDAGHEGPHVACGTLREDGDYDLHQYHAWTDEEAEVSWPTNPTLQ